MRRSLLVGPTEEAVSLPEALEHLQIDEDQWALHAETVARLIHAAEQVFERHAERQLCTATRKLELDRFPCAGGSFHLPYPPPIDVPYPPLVSVTSVEYVDPSGATLVWDAGDYLVNKPAGPEAGEGQIYPKVGKAYPGIARIPNAVAVTFVCGHATADLVPVKHKQAILLMVGYWFKNPESASETSLPLAPPAAALALMDQARAWQTVMA